MAIHGLQLGFGMILQVVAKGLMVVNIPLTAEATGAMLIHAEVLRLASTHVWLMCLLQGAPPLATSSFDSEAIQRLGGARQRACTRT